MRIDVVLKVDSLLSQIEQRISCINHSEPTFLTVATYFIYLGSCRQETRMTCVATVLSRGSILDHPTAVPCIAHQL